MFVLAWNSAALTDQSFVRGIYRPKSNYVRRQFLTGGDALPHGDLVEEPVGDMYPARR